MAKKSGKTEAKKAAPKLWERYEDAVRDIIRQHVEQFELDSVEPQAGEVKAETGKWRIEVIGYTSGEKKVVLFEVRRIKRNVDKPHAAEFAYRIEDTGAARGYFVTPLGRRLTKGAKQVAERTGTMHHIEISADATPENYIMRHLNSMFARFSDSMADKIAEMRDDFRLLLADEHGKPLREVTIDELNEMSKKPRGSA